MATIVNPVTDGLTVLEVGAVHAAFALLAWLTGLHGIAIALVFYAAVLVSERMIRQWRDAPSRRHRAAGLLGLALVWIVVLAFSATVLPSNFGMAIV